MLALEHRWEQYALITLHNLGSDGTTATVRLTDVPEGSVLVDVFDGNSQDAPTGGVEVPLEGYGHRWLRIQTPEDTRLY